MNNVIFFYLSEGFLERSKWSADAQSWHQSFILLFPTFALARARTYSSYFVSFSPFIGFTSDRHLFFLFPNLDHETFWSQHLSFEKLWHRSQSAEFSKFYIIQAPQDIELLLTYCMCAHIILQLPSSIPSEPHFRIILHTPSNIYLSISPCEIKWTNNLNIEIHPSYYLLRGVSNSCHFINLILSSCPSSPIQHLLIGPKLCLQRSKTQNFFYKSYAYLHALNRTNREKK